MDFLAGTQWPAALVLIVGMAVLMAGSIAHRAIRSKERKEQLDREERREDKGLMKIAHQRQRQDDD